jgi:hypothetical protein
MQLMPLSEAELTNAMLLEAPSIAVTALELPAT